MTTLLLGVQDDPALQIIGSWLPDPVLIITSDPLPPEPYWIPRLILSYRYHYRVPASWLTVPAINFHPGPPWWRGVGAVDWALAVHDCEFGVTAHHMTAEVDAGPIIFCRTFPIRPCDTVETLTQRTHAHLLVLADEVIGALDHLPTEPLTHWSGPLRTRAQLDAAFPERKP